MKTSWLKFFRELARDEAGYESHIDIRIICQFTDDHINEMSRRLYMVPMPPGHPIGLSDLACEFIATEDMQ